MRFLPWTYGLLSGVCALAGVTAAQDAPTGVNLLRAVPTTLAVSSTVANANLLPEHLVDGKLSTAWNSKTGELVDAWIAVRLPSDVRVQAIRLTAGFVQQKKTGDLFTMNPRIRRVRVSRAGKTLVEHTLDIENRGLQQISLDQPGGDFEVRVLEVVPGSKPHWRETCVSEIEVIGIPGATGQGKKHTPDVRIGSLDAPPTLTKEQCVRALFPQAKGARTGPDKTDPVITEVLVLPFRPDVVLCSIGQAEKGPDTTTMSVAAVQRAPKPKLLGQPLHLELRTHASPGECVTHDAGVTLEPFPLTRQELGLLVHARQQHEQPGTTDTTTRSTLHRVGSEGLTEILAYESTEQEAETTRSSRCELLPVTPARSLPPLVVQCEVTRGDWHNEDARKNGTRASTQKTRYTWNGTSYAPK